MKVNATNTPKTYASLLLAAELTRVKEWGDGRNLDKLIELFKELLPLFMNCFVMAPKLSFVWSCNHPNPDQRARVQELCQQRIPETGLPASSWETASEMLPMGLWSALRATPNRDLRDIFDELTKAMSESD